MVVASGLTVLRIVMIYRYKQYFITSYENYKKILISVYFELSCVFTTVDVQFVKLAFPIRVRIARPF